MSSSIRQRLTLAILLTAVIPLIAAITIAQNLVTNISSQLYNPRVGVELDRSLNLYKELAAAIKAAMRFQADAIASQEGLRAAAVLHHIPSIDQELTEIFSQHPNLVRLAVIGEQDDVWVEKRRKIPVDATTELVLEVRRPLSDQDDGPTLLAEFSTPKARFDERDAMTDTVQMYRQIEASRKQVVRAHLYTYAVLLAATVLASIFFGALLSRSVGRRIRVLSDATEEVGTGNLAVRVPVEGNDELARLAIAFNRMLAETQRSRARIEFLQRMGTWQEMARRLAHEIKNPLTPIQLAVEELHARYRGQDSAFGNLLDTSLTIVTEEVATLRRLVTEFSEFARLPRATLKKQDICAFLRELQQQQDLLSDDERLLVPTADDAQRGDFKVSWQVPDGVIEVLLDRQMMQRVLVNLMRNAAQAVLAHRPAEGHVQVSLHVMDEGWITLLVDDNGAGVPQAMRESIFDPYVTTKNDGTGLGLAIVKKIVMEHGGAVEVGASDWDGARICVWLPRLGHPASLAAQESQKTS